MISIDVLHDLININSPNKINALLLLLNELIHHFLKLFDHRDYPKSITLKISN